MHQSLFHGPRKLARPQQLHFFNDQIPRSLRTRCSTMRALLQTIPTVNSRSSGFSFTGRRHVNHASVCVLRHLNCHDIRNRQHYSEFTVPYKSSLAWGVESEFAGVRKVWSLHAGNVESLRAINCDEVVHSFLTSHILLCRIASLVKFDLLWRQLWTRFCHTYVATQVLKLVAQLRTFYLGTEIRP